MVPEQKRAWFVVLAFVFALVAIAALIPFVGLRAWGAIGIFGVVGISPLLFRPRLQPGEVAKDERDEKILSNATLGGFATSHAWFVLACMGPWFYGMFQGKERISIQILPFIVVVGMVLAFVTRAVVTLVLYRWKGANGTH